MASEGRSPFFQASDLYFIESGDKIRYFFEASAVDNKGNLCVSKDKALNKIGHALHWLESSFKEVTFSKNVADVCRVLNFKQPVVAQSMYIFKQPQIGGEGKYNFNYLIRFIDLYMVFALLCF